MTARPLASEQLRALYLQPALAGVPWLLDPAAPAVQKGIRRAKARTPNDPCDPRALADDLDDLLVLLHERHFGIATGVVDIDNERLNDWAECWRVRLLAELPTTWGTAIGAALHDLRHLLCDNHVRAVRQEDPELLEAVNPRRHERYLVEDDGPAYEERVVGGVLCVRIRRLWGDAADERAFTAWRNASERHFAYDRIVVDLRGSRGGNDGHVYDWAEPHAPAPVQVAPPDRTWMLDDKPLAGWNGLVEVELVDGPDAVPPLYLNTKPLPKPAAKLWVEEGDGQIPAGDRPWHGRMLVLVDRRTISAGESSAWALRSLFGAKLLGGRTEGCISFGRVVPYLLPRSGLLVILPTKQNLYPGVELIGVPVDVELDPTTPLDAIAADFDSYAG